MELIVALLLTVAAVHLSFNQIAEFAGGITIGGVAVSAGNNADTVIGVGGANDLGTFTGSVIADNQTIKQALQALETEVDASGNEAVGDLVALSGVAANAVNLGTFTGSTISDNGTVKAGMQELETLLGTTTAAAVVATALLSATAGTVTASKSVVVDSNKDITGFRNLTVTGDLTVPYGDLTIGVTAITATGAELNFVDGVTSNVQTQLDAKAPLASPTLTGTVNLPAATNFAAASALTMVDNTADALEIKEGSNQYIAISTTDSGEKVEVFKNVYLDGERLYFNAGAQLIRLKDNQTSALKIENGDGSSLDFLDFKTTNNSELLTFSAPNQFSNTITVGVDDTGYDVKLFGDTASAYALWDASVDDLQFHGGAGIEMFNAGRFVLGSSVVASLTCALGLQNDLVFSGGARNIKFKDNTYNACRFQANNGDIFMGMDTQGDNTIFFSQPLDINTSAQIDGTFTVGVDDTGYDVKFFGATASAYMLWDESADDLILGGAAGLVVPDGQFTLGSTAVTSTAAELNYVDGVTSNVQTQLDAKAALAGPTFTGTPAAPTAGAGTNTTQLATTAFVTTAIATTIDSAPGALDTLNELAAALGDDANFSTTVTNLINANETHIDNVATLSGVAKDSTHLATFTGSTISDNQTVKAAIQALETAVETKQATDAELTELATMASTTAAALADLLEAEVQILDGATLSTTELNYVDGVTSAIQTQLDAKLASSGAQAALHVDHIITLSGVAQAADNLGTFTGGTIADSATIKAALQALETKVEAVQTDVDGNESDADTAIAANETHIDNCGCC